VLTFYVPRLARGLRVLLVLAVGCVDLTPPYPKVSDGPPARDAGTRTGDPEVQPPDTAAGDDASEADVVPVGADAIGGAPDAAADRGPGAGADAGPDTTGSVPPDAGPPPDSTLLAAGSACTLPGQCASGFCAQGRCCDQACSGVCMACDLAGFAGTCRAIPAGEASRGACQAQAASSCGLDGTCNGLGACRLHVSGTVCAAQTCSGTTQTAARQCDGQGVCAAGATVGCGAFQCDAATASCRVGCSQPSHCQPGFTCSGTACVPVPPIASLTVNDTNTSRAALWSLQSSFQIGSSGAHPWGDWPNTYIVSMAPAAAGLAGKQWVKVAAESKQYAGPLPQATITLARTADLYMVIDSRWGSTPAWALGSYTGWDMTVYESASRPALTFRIFRRSAASGSVDLPVIGATTGYNYFLIAD
jgi:hypothetical protein